MKVDTGFWNKDGEYIESIEELTMEEEKEIIIDGVNVAECRHLSFVEEDYCCDCQYEKYASCEGYDCTYKQLKRLDKELKYIKECCIKAGKELSKYSFKWDGKEKNLIVQAMQLNQDYERLQAENEELKHRCEVYHQCDEMIKNTYGQAHKKAMELTKENELIKRLLNDILKIFNLGQYDFLKDQNEIIMALEKAVQKDKDFFEFVELKQENEWLKSELKSQQMINLKQQDIAQDYWNALEEIFNLCNKNITNCDNCKKQECAICNKAPSFSAKIIKIISEVLG